MEPMPVGPGDGAEFEPLEPAFDAVSDTGVVVLTGVVALTAAAALLVCGDGVDASVTVGAEVEAAATVWAGAADEWWVGDARW
jgi:hypothetical protein